MDKMNNNGEPSNLECFFGSIPFWAAITVVIGWLLGKLSATTATITLLICVLLFLSMDYVFWLMRRMSDFFSFSGFIEGLVLPILESYIVVMAGWLILAIFTIVIPTLLTLLIWMILSATIVVRKFIRRYDI